MPWVSEMEIVARRLGRLHLLLGDGVVLGVPEVLSQFAEMLTYVILVLLIVVPLAAFLVGCALWRRDLLAREDGNTSLLAETDAVGLALSGGGIRGLRLRPSEDSDALAGERMGLRLTSSSARRTPKRALSRSFSSFDSSSFDLARSSLAFVAARST